MDQKSIFFHIGPPVRCGLEHRNFVLFWDKPLTETKTVLDFQGTLYIISLTWPHDNL